MKKAVVSIILSAALLFPALAALATAADMPFKDVKKGKWYYSAVEKVYTEGIMNGLKADVFAPDEKMTRAQLVTIICRLSGDGIKGLGQGLTFTDTKKNAWYSDYVGWAVREGVVAGYPDNTFKPNSPVTRAELAVVFARYFTSREIYLADAPLTDSFTDGSKIAKWARDAVETIRLCGIIAGDKAGNFNPSSSATRAEIAMMITRYLSADRLRKIDYLMDHIYEYLPSAGNFASLEFYVSGELTSAGFTERILPYFGLSPDRYEIIADSDELADLRDAWVQYGFGEFVVSILNLGLRDKETGESTAVRTVKFRLSKVEKQVYVDPDDFDPGIDPELYSEILGRSLANRNNTARLYRALEKGRQSGKLNVAFIGGSITQGTGALYAGYASIAANWLERHVASDLTYVNAAIGGTNSIYGAARFSRDVLSGNPDVIFIEYAVNDDPNGHNYAKAQESFESMVHDGLSAENEPAVVIVICHGGQGNVAFMNEIADRYDVPVVNAADAVDFAIGQGAIIDEEFRPDGCHPSSEGHQITSDMLEELFRTTLDEWSDLDSAVAAIGPVPDETVTPVRFRGLTLVDAADLDIVSMGSFAVSDIEHGYGFSHSVTAKAGSGNEPFVFTVTGKTVDLIILRDSILEITVDGGEPVITGDEAFPVAVSDEAATHTISIRPYYEDSDATLLAMAYN